ncbi:hypothetical protein L2U69_03910 [Zavarzinia compransoris]|uniref:hypothetical protein n=1 Tax=Zavarzinia marina TaxID=2911065 RepID=UPI001F449EFF|nr:hypothetical protein [Zavarzinia marina]MCF4164783.1 hypothetical protein [Zavarzinia marina]
MASLALIALAGAQILIPPGTEAPAGGAAPLPEAAAADFMPAAGERAAILARPLFAPDRRPPADDGPAADADMFQVIGIGTAADAATALLRGPGGAALRVLPGQSVAGWRVEAIAPGAVTLTRGDRRLVLEVPKGTP